MKHMAVSLLVAAMLVPALAGCFRQDVRTIVVSVPQINSADCAKVIQDALGRIEGIVAVQPDLAAKTMAVTYDGRKLAIKNIEFLIAGVGFDANDAKAKPDARAALSADCR